MAVKRLRATVTQTASVSGWNFPCSFFVISDALLSRERLDALGQVRPPVIRCADQTSALDLARRSGSLPCVNPISDPFPPRLFDPAVSEIRDGDDDREERQVSDIAMP